MECHLGIARQFIEINAKQRIYLNEAITERLSVTLCKLHLPSVRDSTGHVASSSMRSEQALRVAQLLHYTFTAKHKRVSTGCHRHDALRHEIVMKQRVASALLTIATTVMMRPVGSIAL
eukprot:15897-Heterococcus_DN1.PRE.2